MWPSEWSGDRVVAAIIIGVCTLTAAVIKAYVELSGARSKKRRTASTLRTVRRISGGIVAAGGVVFAALLTGGFLDAPDASALLHVAGGDGGAPAAGPASAASPDADATEGTRPTATSFGGSDGPLADWLQTQATTIYYRYTTHLPDACPGRPTAHGSWAAGLEEPTPVRCGDRGWLAFDIEPLVEQGRVVPNITYCVNFRDSAGVWGRHATQDAPGFDAIAVSATQVPLGRAIGFRYVRSVPYDHVVLTRELPRAAC